MGELPPALANAVQQCLQQLGDIGAIRSISAVGGGCISNGSRVTTNTHHYFLKWHPHAPADMFAAEARGLQLLAQTGCIRVPAVLAQAAGTAIHPPFLLLEWIETRPTSTLDWTACGTQLAELHCTATAPTFGLDHDNYIGANVQHNTPSSDWVSFFRDCRLLPQIERAAQQGLLDTATLHDLHCLLARLPDLIGGAHTPALLHGDLWHGNLLADVHGAPVLIDPAVSYGEREAELAYTELFGRFPAAFYAAYQHTYPLPTDYAARRDLYNLYHLLNHLNLFGASYRGSVVAVIHQYR